MFHMVWLSTEGELWSPSDALSTVLHGALPGALPVQVSCNLFY